MLLAKQHHQAINHLSSTSNTSVAQHPFYGNLLQTWLCFFVITQKTWMEPWCVSSVRKHFTVKCCIVTEECKRITADIVVLHFAFLSAAAFKLGLIPWRKEWGKEGISCPTKPFCFGEKNRSKRNTMDSFDYLDMRCPLLHKAQLVTCWITSPLLIY